MISLLIKKLFALVLAILMIPVQSVSAETLSIDCVAYVDQPNSYSEARLMIDTTKDNYLDDGDYWDKIYLSGTLVSPDTIRLASYIDGVLFSSGSFFAGVSGTDQLENELVFFMPEEFAVNSEALANVLLYLDGNSGQSKVWISQAVSKNGVIVNSTCDSSDVPPIDDDPTPTDDENSCCCCSCPLPPAPPPAPDVEPPRSPPVDPQYDSPAGTEPKIKLNPLPGDGMVNYDHKVFEQEPDVESPDRLPDAPSVLSGMPNHDAPANAQMPVSPQQPIQKTSPLSPNANQQSNAPLTPQAPLPKSSPAPSAPLTPNQPIKPQQPLSKE